MIPTGLAVARRVARQVRRLMAVPAPAESAQRDIVARAPATPPPLVGRAFFEGVLDHLPVGIMVKDAAELRYVLVNRAAEASLGIKREAMLGKHVRDLVPRAAADWLQAQDEDALTRAEPSFHDSEMIETIGREMRLASMTRVRIAGPDGTPAYLLTMMQDVAERGRAEQRIARLSQHDTLTELPNRGLFADLLSRAVEEARRDGGMIAVLAVDLDHFKSVNDALGHEAGDGVLRGVAMRLRLCLRGQDVLARLGSDEFAIIQRPARGVRDAETLAERLIEQAGLGFEVDGKPVIVGLSVGITLSAPGTGACELNRQADLALLGAKQAGGGCARAYVPGMYDHLRHRRRMENELRAALGSDQLTLHYQPQVDLDNRAILGAEALMRWTPPGQGAVPPSIFIPLAEETGLIGPLGAWLLDVACRETMRWPVEMRIAVNVSPIQLRLPGFLAAVKAALERSGLAPDRLELEVTEGVLLQDTDATLAILAELRALGVKLALDDFGTGYASLGYLQKFRFDKIKIDRSFIKGLEADPNARAIVQAVVDLSKSLGMRANAEGVETEEELALLRDLGCMEAQGFLFWRPMPAQAMREMLGAGVAAAG